MKKEPFVIYISNEAKRNEKKITWVGHLVECRDKDSGDGFTIELMMNDALPEDRLIDSCYKAAAKNELVQLSGNSFEYEYMGKSGKVVEMEEYVFRTETHTRTKEAQDMLDNYQHG